MHPLPRGVQTKSFDFILPNLQTSASVTEYFPGVSVMHVHDSYIIEVPAGPFELSLRGWIRGDDGILLDQTWVCKRCNRPIMASDGCKCLKQEITEHWAARNALIKEF